MRAFLIGAVVGAVGLGVAAWAYLFRKWPMR
jgi:hypothetical protein